MKKICFVCNDNIFFESNKICEFLVVFYEFFIVVSCISKVVEEFKGIRWI